jgi:general secretion pathway protein K
MRPTAISQTQRQAGAALLIALLTVSLVAALAGAMHSLQTHQLERERAERELSRRGWLMNSTMQWLLYTLQKQATSHNGEDQQPSRTQVSESLQNLVLPDYLLLSQADALTAQDRGPTPVSAQIVDAQAKLNVSNLIRRGRVFLPELENFEVLFEILGVPHSELKALVTQLEAAQQGRSSPTPLPPQQLEHLLSFGLSLSSLNKLRFYICLLPTPSTINLNTASPEVLSAAVPNLTVANAKKAIVARGDKPWTDLSAALVALGLQDRIQEALSWNAYSLKSDYFELEVHLRGASMEHSEVRWVELRGSAGMRVLHRATTSSFSPASTGSAQSMR